MGVLSETYIMRRLGEFARSDAGKNKISKFRKEHLGDGHGNGSGALSNEKIQKIIFDICDEFKTLVRGVISSFRIDAIHVKTHGFDDQGRFKAGIVIDEDALRRESLHYMNKDMSIGHGDGVDDILALFTHGYSLDKRPFGMWVHDGGNSMTRIGARMHRDPDPFLTDFVNRLNAEYADDCVVTLNDKYKL